ncbi:MAG TPA: ABC transporter permease, partial [Vicinamibacterales bacterium]
MRRFLERLLNLLRVRRPDRDLAREIDSHLALLQDTYEARGLSPDAARRAARLALGNVDLVKENHRDARSFRWIEDTRRDAAHGCRLLRRSPVFAATASLSLAIGIAANTAIFTVANALLFRPPAGIAAPSELVVIGTARGDGGVNPLNLPLYLEVARRTTSLTTVFAEEMFPHVMGLLTPGIGTAEPVLGRYVTANYFGALGAFPSHGRAFADGDEAAAVLDYDYWLRRFNGDDAMVGRVLRLNGRPVTIVGVAAPDFHGTGIQTCDLWLAIGTRDTSSRSLIAGGRLRPGVTIDTAAAELRTIGQAVAREQDTPTDQTRGVNAMPFSRAGANRNLVRGFAAALMVLVSLVLAVACANVAGIMLTRASARAREIALRSALGAGRARLARQLLTETIVLALFSGLLGIGLARVLLPAAMLMLPPLPASIAVPLTLDWRVLLFAMSLSVGAALVFGVFPAFSGSKVDPGSSLRDGVRSSSGRSRLRSAFVVGQIAVSVLLIVLAMSFVRVLRLAGAADPGFDSRSVDIATVDSSTAGTTIGSAAFWRTMIDRVRRTAIVESASLARVPPGGFEGIGLGGVAPADRPDPPEMVSPAWNIVDTGYFATLHIPIVAGRDFAASDTRGAPAVVIVSDALARRFWPGQPVVGKPLKLAVFNARDRRAESRAVTIVGVAGDIRSSSLVDGLAEPYVYVPLAQSEAVGSLDMTAQMSIVARGRGQGRLAPVIATIVQDIDQRLVLTRTESLGDSVALGLTPQRVVATVSGAMGLVALLLAAMGIYGVTAYTVALRR